MTSDIPTLRDYHATLPAKCAPWTMPEVARLRYLYDKGLTVREIGERIDRPYGGVRAAIDRYGIKKNRKVAWPDDEIAKLREMVECGESFAAAAAAIGRTKSATQHMAKRLGLVSKAIQMWTEEEDAYLRENFYTTKRSVLARMLGREPQTIDHRRRKLGMAPKGNVKHA